MKLRINYVLPFFALLAVSSAPFASDQVCQNPSSDSDGDGWGWENDASCTVSRTLTDNSNIFLSTAAPDTAVCSSPAADEDGDGWGWENDSSCIVVAGSTATSQTPNTSGTNAQVTAEGHTICSSSLSDEDGDGWGWENNNSCVVVAAAPATSQTPSTDNNNTTAQVTAAGLTICSASSFDEDGDGWGWENNSSCVVETEQEIPGTTPAEPATPEPVTPEPVTPEPVTQEPPEPAALPATLRIMALGDSITHGTSRDQAESYRKPLNELLVSNSCQFEMVGSQTGNHFHNTYVSPHEGYNGHTADQIVNGHNDNAGNNEGISVTATRYQPHVVLLHIGSNDMRLGQNIDQTIGEIDQILSVLLATDSVPTVLIANLIPWYNSTAVGDNVEILGDRIEAYVTQLGNPRVQLVDVRTGYDRSMMLSDGAHPNPTGEAHIANRFFNAYDSAGFCR